MEQRKPREALVPTALVGGYRPSAGQKLGKLGSRVVL